jgi:hypothetical protein
MAGYSGKPLWQKLGYREGMTVLTINAPQSYNEMLGATPPELRILKSAHKPYSAVHLFETSQDALKKQLIALRQEITQDGMLWVSWPKKSSKMPSDINDNSIRNVALPLGFVDIKVCAVDDTWSGLKLVIRKTERV